MSMISFGGRAARKETQMTSLEGASPDVVAHFEHQVRIERELREARELIEQITHETDERASRAAATIAELKRECSFLRKELNVSTINRDAYQTRAIAAETALRMAASSLVEAINEGNRTATAQAQQPTQQPQGKENAIDLDMTKEIAAKFGADNRKEEQQDDETK